MATAKYTWQIAIVVRISIEIMNNVSNLNVRGFVDSKLSIPKYVFRRYVVFLLPLPPAK